MGSAVPVRATLDVSSFQIEKGGNAPAECEDAFSLGLEGAEAALSTWRCAVADGATESAFSRQWAELLSTELVEGSLFSALFRRNQDWVAALSPHRRRWLERVKRPDLPWYLEQKVEEGAFATILGVQFNDRAFGSRRMTRLRAVAVGDTCLFHVREGALLSSFPLDTAREFTSRPCLVGTRPASDPAVSRAIRRHRASYDEGDRFYLATDALAHFIVKQVEQDLPIWDRLDEIAADPTQATFRDVVERLRHDGLMRNDDVTLITIVARVSPGVGRDASSEA